MAKILYTSEFWGNYQEVIEESPNLEEEIKQRTAWFKKNPDDTRLENHELSRKLSGKWAFSITTDVRIV